MESILCQIVPGRPSCRIVPVEETLRSEDDCDRESRGGPGRSGFRCTGGRTNGCRGGRASSVSVSRRTRGGGFGARARGGAGGVGFRGRPGRVASRCDGFAARLPRRQGELCQRPAPDKGRWFWRTGPRRSGRCRIPGHAQAGRDRVRRFGRRAGSRAPGLAKCQPGLAVQPLAGVSGAAGIHWK